jgi:PAS domain S-box-containing protein
MNLFWKIYVAVFICFVAAVAVIFYVTSARQIFDAEKRIVNEHRIIGSLISNDIERGQAEAKWPFEHLMKLREHPDFLFWWIIEKNGTIHLADKASFIGTCAYGYFPQLADIKVDGNVALNRKKECGIFIKSFGTESNKRAFWLGFSTKGGSEIKRRVIISTATSSALALAILGVGLYFTVNYFTKPIRKLAEGATIIGTGELSHRVEVQSEDELGHLARSFNDMAIKLNESYTNLEEKVEQRTAELASSNTKLEQEVAERKRAQVKLQQHIKQLNCLYELSRLAVQPQISLGQIFQETTGLIRSTYRYPDITCVRITFNGIQYKTDNFQKTDHSQHADISVRGEKAGTIEVYYTSDKQEFGENPFLQEEAVLLDAIAGKLGRIAELKQATDKLQLFRTLIDQSNDCIFILEPKWGRFLDVNDRACESLRYSRKELLEMSIKDIEEFPEDFSWQKQVDELKLKGDIIIQSQHKCKDGTRFFAETSLRFVKEDREDYVIAIARDVTERKKAEDELRQSQELLKSIINLLPIRIFWKDKNSVYLGCNNIFAKDAGVNSPDEVIGKDDFQFVWKEQADLYKSDDEMVSNTGKAKLNYVEPSTTPQGDKIWISTSKVPLTDVNGNIVGVLGAYEDVTERRKAEQRQAELLKEVESTNRELKDFAYIVSHDLKAPLRGIKTLAGWLSADYADKFDEQGKEQMKLLSGRVDRMNNLINGVLEYSRVGRIQENRDIVDLNKLLPEIIDTIAPPENITITVENELPVIECEPTRITQVFQNLLSNAVKYMDKPQGQIKVGCIEENGFWRFSVSDNGPGIEEKFFEKIFQIFQTLAPQDSVESTGIGLTVAKKIVELYGGKIWVESKVEVGSTFFFTLPKQEIEVKNAELEAHITC